MPRRKSGYPRPTGFVGITEIQAGVFMVRIRMQKQNLSRHFHSLDKAHQWHEQMRRKKLATLPRINCKRCGREVPQEQANQCYCSPYCRRHFRKEQDRQRAKASPYQRIEKGIVFNGSVFKVVVWSGRKRVYSTHKTLEDARERRDQEIRFREEQRLKKCPVCNSVFRAKSMCAFYCSTRCGQKARAEGILVRPNGALPSTRRKWREKQRAEREARQQPHIPLQDLIKNKPRPEPVR